MRLAGQYGRYGYRRVHALLQSQGWQVSHGRVMRIWRREGLLEVLVLADVIETITVPPTFESLMYLAAIVLVRTAVSWTLTLEAEGRWPWQASTKENYGV